MRGGDFQHGDAARDIDTPGGARDHLRIVRAHHHRLHPGIDVEPVDHQQIGAPHLGHVAGADLEVVGILGGAGEDVHLHEVAAHRLDEQPVVVDGGDHANPVGGRGGVHQ